MVFKKHSVILPVFNKLKQTSKTCFTYLITRTSSWKAWSTFILIFADASMYVTLSCRANCCPSSCVTWNSKSCSWGTEWKIRSAPSNPLATDRTPNPARGQANLSWDKPRDLKAQHILKPSSEELRRTHLWRNITMQPDSSLVTAQKVLNTMVVILVRKSMRC